MNKDLKKKEEELHFFQEFRGLHSNMPLYDLIQPPPPEPDIVFNLNHQSVGLEITKYYLPDKSLKKNENEQNQIVNYASKIYEKFRLPPVCVQVFWSTFISIEKQQRSYLADTIAKIVAANIPSLGNSIEIEYDEELTCHLPDLITHIKIDRVVDYKSNVWCVPRSAFVTYCTAEEIQEIIEKKGNIYKNYNGNCDLLWLLIVSESSGPSSWCELPIATIQNQYISKFDAAYFLNRSQNKLFELKLLSTDT